jgi:hypothetical protein
MWIITTILAIALLITMLCARDLSDLKSPCFAKANHSVLSSLTLINASAATGQVNIFAGATNKSSAGSFENWGNPQRQRCDPIQSP